MNIFYSRDLIPFCGRPNAGKSSIISKLTGIRSPVGKSHGTTKKIIAFPLYRNILVLDLPGFGKVNRRSKKFAEKVKKHIIEFFEDNAVDIICSILVIDLNTFPTVIHNFERKEMIPLDLEFIDFFVDIFKEDLSEKVIVCANKIDKLSKTSLTSNYNLLREKIPQEVEIIPTSCKTKNGTSQFRNKLKDIVIRKKGKQYQNFLSIK